MSLPPRTAWAAARRDSPHPWPLYDGQLLARDAAWLVFAISRTLLPDDLLRVGFGRDADGNPIPLPDFESQAACRISRPKRLQRERLRIGQPQPALPAVPAVRGVRQAQPPLSDLLLPAWLLGGRLRWRKDRWAYAPRQFSGACRWKAEWEVTQAEAAMNTPHDVTSDQQRELEGLQREKRLHLDPYVDVHRLLHSLLAPNPDEHRPNTCHFGCQPAGSPPQRSRCLHPGHLSWGSPADNAYHAAQHREQQWAVRHRPQGWLCPSSRPGYRRALRLRRAAAGEAPILSSTASPHLSTSAAPASKPLCLPQLACATLWSIQSIQNGQHSCCRWCCRWCCGSVRARASTQQVWCAPPIQPAMQACSRAVTSLTATLHACHHLRDPPCPPAALCAKSCGLRPLTTKLVLLLQVPVWSLVDTSTPPHPLPATCQPPVRCERNFWFCICLMPPRAAGFGF